MRKKLRQYAKRLLVLCLAASLLTGIPGPLVSAKAGQTLSPYTWSDDPFKADHESYNHTIARLCIGLATLAYGDTVFDTAETNSYVTLLKGQFGFDDVTPFYEDTAGESICYSTAYKRITNADSVIDLVVLNMRGTYQMEWLSNFEPGSGITHQSFQKGAQVAYAALADYVKKQGLGQNGNVLKIVVTGHSRGGACANLVAKMLIDEGLNGQTIAAKNLYAYSFATPNSTTDLLRGADRYATIYSIVNPEDFVTKVMPSEWGFGRYGTTYTLPNRLTADSGLYNSFLSQMNSWYAKYVPGQTVYRNYAQGFKTVYDYMREIRSTNLTLGDFTNASPDHGCGEYSLQELYYSSLGAIMCGDPLYQQLGTDSLMKAMTSGRTAQSTASYLMMNQEYFTMAHLAETYLGAMQVLPEAAIFENIPAIHGSVNGPADVTIMNGTNVIAKTNGTEIAVKPDAESGVVLETIGNSRQFWFAKNNGKYTVVLTGRESGKMDFILSELDGDIGETRRQIYKNLDVAPDENYTLAQPDVVGGGGDQTIPDWFLNKPDGEKAQADKVISRDRLNINDILSLNVNVEGIGLAEPQKGLLYGDCVAMKATTDANNEFIGWFDGEQKLSDKATSYFIVKGTTTLTAKFTNVVKEPETISMKETDIALKSGESIYLQPELKPANATYQRLSFTSSDETVATVSKFGILTGVKKGDAEITICSAKKPDVRLICKVKVDGGADQQGPDGNQNQDQKDGKDTKDGKDSEKKTEEKIFLAKPVLSKVSSPKKKTASVTWKSVEGAEGYEVLAATDKKFKKNKKLKTTTKTRIKIKKLKSKKKYFIKVRAYVTDSNGKKEYGKWSKAKRIKVK